MQVSLNLDVTKKEFFGFLSDSIIQDINENTGKKLLREEIFENYNYHKNMKNKMGRQGEVKVTIVEFKPCQIYTAKFQSNQGENIISYNIKELANKKINVTYIEDYIAPDKLKALNFKLVNLLYKKRAQLKSETILKNIENYIHNNRGEIE